MLLDRYNGWQASGKLQYFWLFASLVFLSYEIRLWIRIHVLRGDCFNADQRFKYPRQTVFGTIGEPTSRVVGSSPQGTTADSRSRVRSQEEVYEAAGGDSR